jgi:hypothetical protein
MLDHERAEYIISAKGEVTRTTLIEPGKYSAPGLREISMSYDLNTNYCLINLEKDGSLYHCWIREEGPILEEPMS